MIDENSENAELRLARYLREFVQIRAKAIYDLSKYESVLWIHEMPQENDCLSGAWTEEAAEDEPWIVVRKQNFEPHPSPPEVTLPWIDGPSLKKATPDLPPLRTAILVPDTNAELGEGEEPPLMEVRIEECPEIVSSYEGYRSIWESWSTERRRKDSIQRAYADLFHLHTQVQKQGELVEIVLGMGLLDWRPSTSGKAQHIRRHAVVGNAEIQFDAARGEIRVGPPGDGARFRVEDEMIEAELRPERAYYESMEAQLEELGDDAWDRARAHKALQTWVGTLSANGKWNPSLSPVTADAGVPAMSFAPALILRRRAQTGMVRIYDEMIEKLSNPSISVPHGWGGLIDDDYPTGGGASGGFASGEPSGPFLDTDEVYFPLPANREQRRIVDAINREQGVLVQGPPGTGKSHTIANLMCHLLATGKRILITAESGRPLQVLKDKLPEEIQPLCVSLLGQGGDSFSELNRAVQGITTRQASFSSEATAGRIAEIDVDLDGARRRRSEIDLEIGSLREDETCPHSVGDGAYSGTASAIAERVSRERPEFGWLKLALGAPSRSPLSAANVGAWLSSLRTHTESVLADASLAIPTSSDFPSPSEFSAIVESETQALRNVEAFKERLEHPAYDSLHSQPPALREALRQDLILVEKRRSELLRAPADWLGRALKDLFSGKKAAWQAVLECSRANLDTITKSIERIGSNVVDIPRGLDKRKARADAAVALEYFRAGGKWTKFGLLTPSELKGRTYLRKEILVEGRALNNSEDLDIVCHELDGEFALSEVEAIWADLGVEVPGNSRPIKLAVLKDHAVALEDCFRFAQLCDEMAEKIRSSRPPIVEPDWINGGPEAYLGLLDAADLDDEYGAAAEKVNACTLTLSRTKDLHNPHPVNLEMLSAVESRSVAGYSESHASLVSLERIRADVAHRERVERELGEYTPGLVERVRSSFSEEHWDSHFEKWDQAWSWALADSWLEKRSDPKYQRRLLTERSDIERKIGKLIAETASLRAWSHFFARLKPRESAALRSWREAVRAMGRGTGKSAKQARLRREARQEMAVCRDAIPIWIMPRYLVAEMISPEPERYDLVIVDEASQLGIESLFLFYLAKKMIVVGDDQQISPYGVGIADEAVANLQQHFLEDIRYKHALSAQSSVYGNAKIRFNQNIVLREHFRCMPEIIQFSNDLCYAANGTPLDPLRAYTSNRIDPLVLRQVPDGYRKGGQNAVNPPEADAVVAQIAACIEDDQYDGLSMGVISLQGEAQAKLIEQKLLHTLDAEVIDERRLICGDAYAFQGDERNVIFLSMVAAAGEKRIGVLAGDAARQRFNVAVSRAQDQLWLFHTAGLDVLSESCMRHRLLSYMQNPTRRVADEDQQTFDSKFERHVFQKLSDKGFFVRTQVCVGDPTNHRYRIDLVVEGMQGRLAVECDGDAWHGADRYEADMARQRDLERAGWQFARVRGGDFYRDPEEAMEPVWAELERLGIEPGGIDSASTAPPDPARVVNDFSPPAEVSQPADMNAGDSRGTGSQRSPSEDSKADATQPPARAPESQTPPADTGSLERHVPGGQIASRASLPLFEDSSSSIHPDFDDLRGPDPRTASPAQVAAHIRRIVEKEAPVVAKRVYGIYLRGCGIHRMGGELKSALNKGMQHAIRKNQIEFEDELGKGGLLYSVVRPVGTAPVVARPRGQREFEEIPPSELQLVARRIASKEGFEIGSDSHLRAVLEYFDLKRLTAQASSRIQEAMKRNYPYVDESLGGDGN